MLHQYSKSSYCPDDDEDVNYRLRSRPGDPDVVRLSVVEMTHVT